MTDLAEARRGAVAESWRLRREARDELGEPPPPAAPAPVRLELVVTCLHCASLDVEVYPFTGGGVHLCGRVFCRQCRAGGRITVLWANSGPGEVLPTVLT